MGAGGVSIAAGAGEITYEALECLWLTVSLPVMVCRKMPRVIMYDET